MPPANSPNSERPQSLISALRELESPINADVLNLAATLGTQTDDDSAAHDSIRHLSREHEHDEHDQLRLDRSRERLRLLERQRDELDHRDRLRRVMSRLSRLSDSSNSNSNSHSAAYGDRVPSQNSLYDWSPAIEHEATAADEDELDHILAELRREQPNTHPEILRVLGRSQLDSERERIRSISNRLNQERAGAGAGSAGESLRSTAILQSVRRHPRFSARTREYLQRYNSDRDAASRPSQFSESQSRYMSESARHLSMQRLSDSRTSLDRERRDMLSRADSYRRGYLDHRSSTSTPTVSPMLEQVVRYLSRIRHSNTIDDSWHFAEDAGFSDKHYSCRPSGDFVTDTFSIPPPVETSWLAPGAILSGCQHATSATTTTAAPGTTTATQQFQILDPTSRAAISSLSNLAPPSRPWLANSFSTSRSRSSQLGSDTGSAQAPQQDRWPVKVTIHEVDWDKMSLSATMEAYNVPSHPHSQQSILSNPSEPATQQYTRTSSITTYLEGEILDFNHHTLLTESFKSNASNDATYWRKLPPFQKLSDEEVVMALTSKKWFTEVLNKEYILMRWKERCFVKSLARSEPVQQPPSSTFYGTTNESLYRFSHLHSSSSSQPTDPLQQHTPYRLVRDPTTNVLQVEITPASSHNIDAEHATFDDSGCGLTISGFYYVCLRRSDGVLEGLYYDPQSSPYQCLKLESRIGGTVGAWEFR